MFSTANKKGDYRVKKQQKSAYGMDVKTVTYIWVPGYTRMKINNTSNIQNLNSECPIWVPFEALES